MTKFYITFTKTTMYASQDDEKMKWNTINNCITIIDADTKEEATDKLYDQNIKDDGDKITNVKVSTVNPIF